MHEQLLLLWFFGFAGVKRLFDEAFSLRQYINISKATQNTCQHQREL